MAAIIMSWQKYKKDFEPELIARKDAQYGTLTIIEPTMQSQGFMRCAITDLDDWYNYPVKFKTPTNIIKDHINPNLYSIIVYHKWRWRDWHGTGFDIYYK